MSDDNNLLYDAAKTLGRVQFLCDYLVLFGAALPSTTAFALYENNSAETLEIAVKIALTGLVGSYALYFLQEVVELYNRYYNRVMHTRTFLNGIVANIIDHPYFTETCLRISIALLVNSQDAWIMCGLCVVFAVIEA